MQAKILNTLNYWGYHISSGIILLILITGCGKSFKSLDREELLSNYQSTQNKFENNGSNNNENSSLPARWQIEKFPLQVNIDQNFRNDEVSAIEEMGSVWENGVNNQIPFFKFIVNGPSLKSENDFKNYQSIQLGIYKGTEWFPEDYSSALAITQFSGRRTNVGSSNEYIDLEHADIIINYQNYFFKTDTTPVSNVSFDLASVVLHEMGHFLGLFHVSDPSAVMSSTIGPFTSRRSLSPLDKDQLSNIYLNGGITRKKLMKMSITGADFKTSDLGDRKDLVSHKEGEKVYGVIELIYK